MRTEGQLDVRAVDNQYAQSPDNAESNTRRRYDARQSGSANTHEHEYPNLSSLSEAATAKTKPGSGSTSQVARSFPGRPGRASLFNSKGTNLCPRNPGNNKWPQARHCLRNEDNEPGLLYEALRARCMTR
jgi:hypothetical protein